MILENLLEEILSAEESSIQEEVIESTYPLEEVEKDIELEYSDEEYQESPEDDIETGSIEDPTDADEYLSKDALSKYLYNLLNSGEISDFSTVVSSDEESSIDDEEDMAVEFSTDDFVPEEETEAEEEITIEEDE